MHKIFGYSAFGWLSLSGVLHFFVDVVSQHYRGKRLPGLETTYYYGMHTAYALGQDPLRPIEPMSSWSD